MPKPTATTSNFELEVKWGHNIVPMFRFPEEGSLIGHIKRTKKFLYIPLSADGKPAKTGEGGLEIGTIDNVDDDESFVAKLNNFFGTKVTIKDFPGR
jgi:hypothetical protein